MTSRSKASALSLALCASALLATLGSCMADTRHLAFTYLNDGWAHTDTLTYTISPMSGVEQSAVYLLLCTEGYSYGNIATTIIVKQDTALLYRELREYILKDNKSKRGIGHRNDYTLPVGNVTLCDTLPTTITLTQQLDQPLLTGIRGVGIRMASPMHQPDEPVWKFNW